MEEYFALNLIDPNPFQPRESESAEHIHQLAASIAADGLMQIPTGRRSGDHVQLAFGHSRLAAYYLLYQIQGALEDHRAVPFDFEDGTPLAQAVVMADRRLGEGVRFKAMPVIIRELTDEDMFRMAVSENVARNNLSALEVAKAMDRYATEFGKSSAQIGELFGCSDSAVRNKRRLLQLPEDLRNTLANVPELTLREILFMLDLPEGIRREAERTWTDSKHPSEIIRAAASGATADKIHERVNEILINHAEKLGNQPWKYEDPFDGTGIVGACKGCPYLVKRDKQDYCANKECYWTKKQYLKAAYLREASEATGWPMLEAGESPVDTSEFYSGSQEVATFETAQEAKCPNLRLIYFDGSYERPGQLPGYPHAMLVCKKRRGFCTCRQAVHAGLDLQQKAEVDEAVSDAPVRSGEQDETNPPMPVTADRLKDIAREARQRQREIKADYQAMQLEVAKAFADALESGNPWIWRRLADRVASWQSRDEIEPAFEYRLVVARALVGGLYYDGGQPVLSVALEKFNQVLKEAQLPELKPAEDLDSPTLEKAAKPAVTVSVETPKTEPPHSNDKTLSEVFGDGDPANIVPGKRPEETLVEYFKRTGQIEEPERVWNCIHCDAEMVQRSRVDSWECPECGWVMDLSEEREG